MTDRPIRIQRKRTKGWRMPENTVYVGRGSAWGNPFPTHDRSTQEAIKLYQEYLLPYRHRGVNNTLEKFFLSQSNLEAIKSDLRGKNLACWCRLDQPCHADFLLEIAND